MNFDQIIPIIYLIGVLILVLPGFLHSNSKLKQFLSNLSIWVIIVLIVTTISYFLFK
jgi:predicted aspartyl protease